jgi:hypothetical protein
MKKEADMPGIQRIKVSKKEINMERYKNIGGDSSVVAYEIEGDSIKVQFCDRSLFLYNYQSAGNNNIEQMKKLAIAGKGLNSFIRKVVKKRYAAKLR